MSLVKTNGFGSSAINMYVSPEGTILTKEYTPFFSKENKAINEKRRDKNKRGRGNSIKSMHVDELNFDVREKEFNNIKDINTFIIKNGISKKNILSINKHWLDNDICNGVVNKISYPVYYLIYFS